MASTYSSNLRLTLIGDGEQSGVWGQTTNTNLGTLLEQSITGVVPIVMIDANYTLTNYNGTSDEARQAVLDVSGVNTGVRDVIAPGVEKLYVVRNNTTGGYAIRIKTSGGAALTIPSGVTTAVFCDGTDFYEQKNGTNGPFSIGGALYVGGNIYGTTATFLGAISAVSPSFTGVPTATTAAVDTNTTQIASTAYVINQGYLKSSTAASIYAPLASPALTGTPTAPTAANGTNTTQIATTAFVQAATTALGLGTMATQNANNVNITGGSITGITDLAVADGGTGASSFTSGALLKGNGSSAISAASASDIVTAIGATAVQNATSATSATTATNVAGGSANRIPYNTAPDTTSYIVAPSVSSTYLRWNGATFDWSSVGAGTGTVTSVSGSGGSTGLTLTGGPITTTGTLTLGGILAVGSGGTGANTASGARSNLGLGSIATQDSSNVNISGGSISGVSLSGVTLSGYATLSGTNSFSGANSFTGGITSTQYNFNSTSSIYLSSSTVKIDIASTNIAVFDQTGGAYRMRFANTNNGIQWDGSGVGIGISGGSFWAIYSAYIEANTSDVRKPGGGPFNASVSDARLKDNVVNYTQGLNAVKQLRPVNYNLNDVTKLGAQTNYKTFTGLIAQEVQETDLSNMVIPGMEGYLTLDVSELTYTLVNAVKELSAQVDALKAEVAALKGN